MDDAAPFPGWGQTRGQGHRPPSWSLKDSQRARSSFPGPPPLSPLSALTDAAQTLQSSATSLVLHARETPAGQRLVYGYEVWESCLRNECQARQRLATTGFQPAPQGLQSFAPRALLGNDDWDLLRRVNQGSRSVVPSSSAQGGGGSSGGTAPFGGFGGFTGGGFAGGAGMKRSASEGMLKSHRQGRSGNNPMDLQEFGDTLPTKAQQGQGLTVRKLLRHPPPSSFQELGQALNVEAARNLDAVAASILEGGKQALQHSLSSIQQTASNCHNNLTTLSTILQHGLTNGGVGGANGGGRGHDSRQRSSSSGGGRPPLETALVPFSDVGALGLGTGLVGGALVPWSVFPRYLMAREQDAADSAEEASGSPTPQQWYAPLQQYMDHMTADALRGAVRLPARPPSLRDPGRQVAIVTTAALPWMTGTAVNPLLRAAYLATDTRRRVTLVLPWLALGDQERVFPNNITFESPEAQEAYIRDWARKRTGLECNFKVTFYPGRYAAEKGSILPVGDVTSCIPDHEADVAVLEEPEHLNWYHHGRRWTDKFNHVVGVMHTNYLDYARREDGGQVKQAALKFFNQWVCRVHCHKVIKLSDAVQGLPRQETMFVHGVSPAFLRVGEEKARQATAAAAAEQPVASTSGRGEAPPPTPTWRKGAYFIGKVVWAKGYTELLDRLKEHSSRSGDDVPVDVYGTGPDLRDVEDEAGRRHLNVSFNGARDHADASLQEYKVFINPSLSDVVATTTAEALAMGKFVVCADHPSNAFFKEFPNCLVYRDSEEFSQCLQRAMTAEPAPLTPSDLHKLTWEAATERFLDVAEIKSAPPLLESLLDNVLAVAHNALTSVEAVRVAAGGGSRTRDTPARITDFRPSNDDIGGIFDNHTRARANAILRDHAPPPPKTGKKGAAAAAAAAATTLPSTASPVAAHAPSPALASTSTPAGLPVVSESEVPSASGGSDDLSEPAAGLSIVCTTGEPPAEPAAPVVAPVGRGRHRGRKAMPA